jgi:hypothetical protein
MTFIRPDVLIAKADAIWICPECRRTNPIKNFKCNSCDNVDMRYITTYYKDGWNADKKYLHVYPTTRLREAQQFGLKHFVEGTYVITYYTESKYYTVWVQREEALAWVENTDVDICGNCTLIQKRTYLDKSIIWSCHKDGVCQSVVSLGRTCPAHRRS